MTAGTDGEKVAILQVADTGPLESLVVMLRTAGYKCLLPGEELKAELRSIGCDTVLDVESLVRGMGYSRPMDLPLAEPTHMTGAALYVDVKGHRNGPRVIEHWPNLKGKVLWYRINGGKPEHVVNARGDHGDEVNPPCPVLTPNQWYKGDMKECKTCGHTSSALVCDFTGLCDKCQTDNWRYFGNRAYTCWPPFVRFHNYASQERPDASWYQPPVCLIHNLTGWGYGRLVEPFRGLGVRMYGAGSPDGLLPHHDVPNVLNMALAYVHLKSSDAPGYVLYEAMAAGCPVICTRRLIWRCRMQGLLISGETCLVFDRETHDALSDEDVENCTAQVHTHLRALQREEYNRLIGKAGRERLLSVMWNEHNPEDVVSLRDFLRRNFP